MRFADEQEASRQHAEDEQMVTEHSSTTNEASGTVAAVAQGQASSGSLVTTTGAVGEVSASLTSEAQKSTAVSTNQEDAEIQDEEIGHGAAADEE